LNDERIATMLVNKWHCSYETDDRECYVTFVGTEKRALPSASRPVQSRRMTRSMSRPPTNTDSCASKSISQEETGQFTSPDPVTSH